MKSLRTVMLVMGLISAGAALNAAPLYQYPTGTTQVAFSSTLTTALSQLQVTLAPLPESKVTRRGIGIFRISSGTVDLGTAKGEILHEGGLVLKAGANTVVLSNFLIDTSDTPFELTGTVSANGAVIGRIGLFNITLGENAISVPRAGRLRITPAALTLTAAAADALNGVFGVTAFTEGLSVGTATVDATRGRQL